MKHDLHQEPPLTCGAAATEALLGLVQSGPLTVMLRDGGPGNEIRLRAELYPLLQAHGFRPITILFRWDHCTEAEFAAAMQETGGSEYAAAAVGMLAATNRLFQQPQRAFLQQVRGGGFGLYDSIPDLNGTLREFFQDPANRLPEEGNGPIIPLLVFDRFEEVFTLGRQTPDRSAEVDKLLAQLADLVDDRGHAEPAPVRVLLVMREDFQPHLEELRQAGLPVVEGCVRRAGALLPPEVAATRHPCG